MKSDNLIYLIATILVIISAVFKIYHVPNSVFYFAITIAIVIIYQAFQNHKLKTKIKELENKEDK